jgi:transposase
VEKDLLETNDIDALRRLALDAWHRAEELEKTARLLTDEKRILADEKLALAGEKTVLKAKNVSLVSELEVLLAQISELTVKLAMAKGKDVQLELELQLKTLRGRLAGHAQETYGDRSERRRKGRKKDKKDTSNAKGHGPTAQPKLPIQECVLELPDDACGCSKCGADLRVMAEQFEESELIASVQRRFVMKLYKRQKYNCRACGHIDTAPALLKLIPGGRYDLSFVVQVAIDKYLDALPLERQVRRMRRRGLDTTSQTLWDQLWAMYVVLLPTLLELQRRVLAADLVHADETTWRQMGKGRSKKWWLWTLVSTGGVFFELLPSRGSEAARKLFAGYDGIVMADCYAVYIALERALEKTGGEQLTLDGETLLLPNFLLAACWMHARRPLFKAEKDTPEVTEALDLIAELYAVEAEAKRMADGDEQALLEHRSRLRNQQSRSIIARLEAWRDAQRPLPRTQYARGVGFLKNNWVRLIRFLEDPRIPLDNGEAERQIRGPVVGRKNYYGTRSERGARVASMMFSLLGTCTQVGVVPYDYLLEALTRGLREPGTIYLPQDHAAAVSGSAK